MASTPPPPVDKELDISMKTRLAEVIPKLVPEVEYGNVEYKLKLLNPSPERFTRLVTQMKWRLLEGGGQAYYELGVADSGQLIGLSRRDLEASLETLEMMAGEIGASVIIVKEIEVPAALVGRAMHFALGIPERTPGCHESELDANASTATETSATEDDDSVDTPPSDSEPALSALSRQTHFNHALDIEIASVYKPRPLRSRPLPTNQTRPSKRGSHPKANPKPRRQQRSTEAEDLLRAEEKRVKRDTRRDARRKALLAPDVGAGQAVEEGVFDLDLDTEVVRVTTHAPVPCVSVSDPQVLLPTLEALALEGSVDSGDVAAPIITVTDVSDQPITAHEPRLIVEALVVRKLALEEAFLDFGGFALEL
ncbi:hypothetical protein BU17DRAFT_102013 [Hysterangium stoloniferum]|nr:hypothetical protein BU17DRAFT_102013 [Hysterangium stoloniferum]